MSFLNEKNPLIQLSHPTGPPKNKLVDKNTLNEVGFFNNSLFELNYEENFGMGVGGKAPGPTFLKY